MCKAPSSVAKRTLVPTVAIIPTNVTISNTPCIKLTAARPVSPRICPQMTESESPMRNSAAIANVAAGRKDLNFTVAKVTKTAYFPG